MSLFEKTVAFVREYDTDFARFYAELFDTLNTCIKNTLFTATEMTDLDGQSMRVQQIGETLFISILDSVAGRKIELDVNYLKAGQLKNNVEESSFPIISLNVSDNENIYRFIAWVTVQRNRSLLMVKSELIDAETKEPRRQPIVNAHLIGLFLLEDLSSIK